MKLATELIFCIFLTFKSSVIFEYWKGLKNGSGSAFLGHYRFFIPNKVYNCEEVKIQPIVYFNYVVSLHVIKKVKCIFTEI